MLKTSLRYICTPDSHIICCCANLLPRAAKGVHKASDHHRPTHEHHRNTTKASLLNVFQQNYYNIERAIEYSKTCYKLMCVMCLQHTRRFSFFQPLHFIPLSLFLSFIQMAWIVYENYIQHNNTNYMHKTMCASITRHERVLIVIQIIEVMGGHTFRRIEDPNVCWCSCVWCVMCNEMTCTHSPQQRQPQQKQSRMLVLVAHDYVLCLCASCGARAHARSPRDYVVCVDRSALLRPRLVLTHFVILLSHILTRRRRASQITAAYACGVCWSFGFSSNHKLHACAPWYPLGCIKWQRIPPPRAGARSGVLWRL